MILKELIALKEEKDSADAGDIFSRLQRMHPDEKIEDSDVDAVKGSINRLLKKGWTDSEIVSHMKNMEEVNPDLDEDTALKRMKAVQDKVEARLKEKK